MIRKCRRKWRLSAGRSGHAAGDQRTPLYTGGQRIRYWEGEDEDYKNNKEEGTYK
jgi:hypothetical protein